MCHAVLCTGAGAPWHLKGGGYEEDATGVCVCGGGGGCVCVCVRVLLAAYVCGLSTNIRVCTAPMSILISVAPVSITNCVA